MTEASTCFSNENRILRGQLISDLKSCTSSRDLRRGRLIHELAIQSGDDSYSYIANTLINMYAKCGSIDDARKVFEKLDSPDVVSWTVLMLGYAEAGDGETCFQLFLRMDLQGCAPNGRTFVAVAKACTELAVREDKLVAKKIGAVFHLLASMTGCDANIYLQSTLVVMYSKCGCMKDARLVFDAMIRKDVVSWTALILGYADNGESMVALSLFVRMSREGFTADNRSFVAALKACTDLAASKVYKEKGKAVHLLASGSGCDLCIFVLGTLVNMYSKSGTLNEAQKVFSRIPSPDVLCWNALILGYIEQGQSEMALNLFSLMGCRGCEPDAFTLSAVMMACGIVGALELGRKLHAKINTHASLRKNTVLMNSVLDFYAKCGSLLEAEQVFESHSGKNVITWNSLISCYARHGNSESVLSIFDRMLRAGIKPDRITFNCILTACGHAGFVDKAKYYFDEMVKYGIYPDVEHYNSMIDLFGRANKLDDAMNLLWSMPFAPTVVTWMSILGACRRWKNAEYGKMAFDFLKAADVGNSGVYVLMANINEDCH